MPAKGCAVAPTAGRGSGQTHVLGTCAWCGWDLYHLAPSTRCPRCGSSEIDRPVAPDPPPAHHVQPSATYVSGVIAFDAANAVLQRKR